MCCVVGLKKLANFLCVGFHCRCVVCACSAGAVGSFSNKPLSPKKKLARIRNRLGRTEADRYTRAEITGLLDD